MKLLSLLLTLLLPVFCQAALVLQLTDLGPATEVNGNNSTGVVVGQKANAATTFSGGTTTQIVAPNSTAIAIAGNQVIGTRANPTPEAFRYNTSTNNQENFGTLSGSSFTGVDIRSDGTAIVQRDSATLDRPSLCHPDNSRQQLSTSSTFYSRGLNESDQLVGYNSTSNGAQFYTFINLATASTIVSNYDPTAGFEGNLTAGKKVSTNEPAYYQLGGSLTLVPKLHVTDTTGEVTAFNTVGKLVGNWNSAFFLYNINTLELTNLSTLVQTGDPFASIGVPTAIDETGKIYGIGMVNEGGPLVAHAYLAKLVAPGDFNGDNTVDAADYVVWRKNNGPSTDYDLWRANYGQTISGSGSSIESASIPEPSALLLLGMSAFSLLGYRKAKSHG